MMNQRRWTAAWFAVSLVLVWAIPQAAVALSPAARAGDPAKGACTDLRGRYDLSAQHGGGGVAEMEVVSQHGRSFVVVGAGWQGRGEIVGTGGYYDWRFDDGRHGRTAIRIDGAGRLLGAVRQRDAATSDLWWDYVGERHEGPLSTGRCQ